MDALGARVLFKKMKKRPSGSSLTFVESITSEQDIPYSFKIEHEKQDTGIQ